ncbi:MAG: glycosyltransferase family 4 protein [Chloroflexi bacterium]|nr:glycosyltransferase family 4 protein [Chloroflexota bacterium]MBI3760446.1 glycosyltransferase family 4 protein [Chloroflexota bacterium]
MPTATRHVGLNAHLLSGRANYRSAGIHHYLHNLLQHLPAAAPDMQLTIFVGEGDAPAGANVTVRRSRWPTGQPPVRIAWEQIALPWALAGERIDLLHSLAFVSPLIQTCPTVVTVYDLSFVNRPQNFRAFNRAYLRGLTGLSCRRARRVIAISHSTKRDLIAGYGLPEDRVTVVYPGAEPEFRRLPKKSVETFRAAQGLPEDFVLYLGTLEPRKNVDVLVRAFASVKPRGVKLVLAGAPGWHVEEISRAIEEAGVSDDVILPGYVSAEEKPLWYNAAQIFVYPSEYEGFGLPVLEALACGRPVITTNASSLPEVAGDAAWLVPPRNTQALAGALNDLLAEPARQTDLAARGPAQAGKFSWPAAAERTAAVYRRALRGA